MDNKTLLENINENEVAENWRCVSNRKQLRLQPRTELSVRFGIRFSVQFR